MKLNLTQLKKLENRTKRATDDPETAIKMVSRIILLASSNCPLPVPEEKKVTLAEFIEFFGNTTIDNSLETGKELEKVKQYVRDNEEQIRKIGGFSDESLPEGLEIKYR